MSNYPLSYKLSWLPRFLKPSLRGDVSGFAPAAQALMQPMPASTVRLAFVGDISAVANHDVPVIDPALAAVLSAADLVVGNCESPVIERPRARFGTWLGTRHAMTPAFLAAALEAAGVRPTKLVLSVANNHMLDQGAGGFDETLATLRGLGIRPIGTAVDGPVARVAAGPITLGFAAFTQWRNAGQAAFAGRVAMAGEQVRTGDGIDFLCAAPHWDWEFRHFPRAETRLWAQRLAGQGFGLIAGHHAHVVQPVERIGKTVVAYGLGDFLGTVLPRQPWPGRIGAMLLAEVSTDLATRGSVAAYQMRFFYRQREGVRERLVPIEALEGPARSRVEARLAAIYGKPRGG
ncbi:metallophosphatase [Mesorhizobium sp. Root157]|uniref:CapA family protein n=1 Tax=Mesorhizobium sp. Root157 TaxID=1736477 RepID=UPI0006FBE6BE|nr:CapA family protein [Mesorhizobium sp. Root157]KQZ87269.1 metallophosphatase [Mesorhizobium sp. Root157]